MFKTRYEHFSDLEVNTLYRTEIWNNLLLEERLDALQELENRSANSCGNKPCKVELEDLGEDYGGYSPDDCKIYLNENLVRYGTMINRKGTPIKFSHASIELMDTIHHENYHAYQDEVAKDNIRHHDPFETQLWKANINPKRYINNDYNLYRIQSLERTAWEHALDVSVKSSILDILQNNKFINRQIF